MLLDSSVCSRRYFRISVKSANNTTVAPLCPMLILSGVCSGSDRTFWLRNTNSIVAIKKTSYATIVKQVHMLTKLTVNPHTTLTLANCSHQPQRFRRRKSRSEWCPRSPPSKTLSVPGRWHRRSNAQKLRLEMVSQVAMSGRFRRGLRWEPIMNNASFNAARTLTQ